MSERTNPPGYVKFQKQIDPTISGSFEGGIKGFASKLEGNPSDRIVEAFPVYLVDPNQNGVGALETMTIWNGSALGDAAGFGSMLLARVQRIDSAAAGVLSQNKTNAAVYDFSNYGFHGTSAVHTALVAAFDTKGLAQGLSIIMKTSAGTATLAVHGSMDNFATQDIDIDDVAAAGTTVKNYDRGHADVGATAAVSPLNWRYLKITAGDAGVGNTTTLDIAMK